MCRGTQPVVTGKGQVLVTGEDVNQVLCNVLERLFNPEGGSVLVAQPQKKMKVSFNRYQRADRMDDEMR